MCFDGISCFSGKNRKLNLSGRQSRDVGILCTSKLYALQDKIFAFTPQVWTRQPFLAKLLFEQSLCATTESKEGNHDLRT